MGLRLRNKKVPVHCGRRIMGSILRPARPYMPGSQYTLGSAAVCCRSESIRRVRHFSINQLRPTSGTATRGVFDFDASSVAASTVHFPRLPRLAAPDAYCAALSHMTDLSIGPCAHQQIINRGSQSAKTGPDVKTQFPENTPASFSLPPLPLQQNPVSAYRALCAALSKPIATPWLSDYAQEYATGWGPRNSSASQNAVCSQPGPRDPASSLSPRNFTTRIVPPPPSRNRR